MKKIYPTLLIIFALLLAVLTACGQSTTPNNTEPSPTPTAAPIATPTPIPTPVPQADVFALTADMPGYISLGFIHTLNDEFYNRLPFTYTELGAAMWIADTLLHMGHPAENIQIQSFSWEDTVPLQAFIRLPDVETAVSMFAGHADDARNYSQNVILTVPGRSDSTRTIIVGAHYDSVYTPGASDNASGTALLMESAYRLLHQDNYYTILYIFFGAEEIGLLGAYYFIEGLSQSKLDDIIVMINADVLIESGRSGFGTTQIVDYEHVENNVTAQINAIAQGLADSHGIYLINEHRLTRMGSDHLPFVEAGLSVVVLASLDIAVLHTPYDCIHYLNERWPGMVDEVMWRFSIFLDKMLMEISAMY